MCHFRMEKLTKQLLLLSSLHFYESQATDCLNIFVGQHNNTKYLESRQVSLFLDDIDIDHGKHQIQVKSHFTQEVSSMTSLDFPIYFSLFEAFITKPSCAVVLPSKANVLRWNHPYAYNSIPSIRVTIFYIKQGVPHIKT